MQGISPPLLRERLLAPGMFISDMPHLMFRESGHVRSNTDAGSNSFQTFRLSSSGRRTGDCPADGRAFSGGSSPIHECGAGYGPAGCAAHGFRISAPVHGRRKRRSGGTGRAARLYRGGKRQAEHGRAHGTAAGDISSPCGSAVSARTPEHTRGAA